MSSEAVIKSSSLRFEQAAEALRDAGTASETPRTLAELRRGERTVIAAIDAASPEVQRLMTLGLVEGAEIELAGAALGGDPLEFRLFGRGVSLRKAQARMFSIGSAGVRD
jgi:Fe2+ transport system protein FeoA